MIAIPNMEKPKSCDDCMFEGEDWGCVIIPDAWWLRTMEEVYKYCPLIEIVTCGECIHWHEHEWYNTCDKHIGHGFEDDFFCAYGERNSKNNSNSI